MNDILAKQEECGLEKRLAAQLLLHKMGWDVSIKSGSTYRGARLVHHELYVAQHRDEHYPQQQARTVAELVERCLWQEKHRTPRRRM